ncbi:nitroreductase family protein [Clostridium sp. ATCC 25772]|uniref:nitroreductase family protein n=1 Tax=Clostridium sp. ATCC 25772 TaxID=1676991 RepID=UPI0007814B2B|nr:nitroreductase family protein [Clostridium sp. ATCC 25772]
MEKIFLDVIKSRRSVRAYKDEQVKDEQLELILEGGMWAPSGINQQSWHFTVVQNKELLNDISNETKKILQKGENDYLRKLGENENLQIFYNAPTVILVSGDEKAATPMEDTSAAVQNMLLVAESMSIGTCWVGTIQGLFSHPQLGEIYKKKCNIPEGYKVYHAVSVGYKKIEGQKAPRRKENKINYIKHL